MWLSGPQLKRDTADWKSRNANDFLSSWTDVEDAFGRLQVKQQDLDAPAAPGQDVVPSEACKETIGSSAFVADTKSQPAQCLSQIPDSATVSDVDAHRLFLGRRKGAEQCYKVFCLLSSPGADDTSWGPLRCSESQVAVYEGAITQSTRLAVVAQCVPDAYLNPSTRILRLITAPAREHIAALDDGAPLIWDRSRIESTFCPSILQEALCEAAPASPQHPTTWQQPPGPGHRTQGTRRSFDACGPAAAGGRKKTPIPHVHGITSWRGPPIKLDPATKKQLKQKLLDAIRSTPPQPRDRAGVAGLATGAAGSGASSASDMSALISRSASLPPGGYGRAMHAQHGSGLPHAVARQPRPDTHGTIDDITPRGDAPERSSAFQGYFDPAFAPVSSRPCVMHDQHALHSGRPWEPRANMNGTGGPGVLGQQFLAMNHAPVAHPAPAHPYPPWSPHGPYGMHPDAPGLSNGSNVADGVYAAEGARARMMAPQGTVRQMPAPLGLMHGDMLAEGCAAAPAVPPQEMAKLMFRLAQQLGYPVQRMQEVVSCMQQDYLQAVTGAATW